MWTIAYCSLNSNSNRQSPFSYASMGLVVVAVVVVVGDTCCDECCDEMTSDAHGSCANGCVDGCVCREVDEVLGFCYNILH